MKRFLSLILSVALLLTIIPTGLFDTTVYAASDTFYDDPYTYKVYYDYSPQCTDIVSCSTSLSGHVVIPSSLNGVVTWLCDNSFSGCNKITSVIVPNTIGGIGKYAFSNCTSLASITIPSSVTTIKDYAFSNCNNLIIYCEASSAPSGWSSKWNSSNCPVIWNYKNNNVASDGYIYVTIDGVRYGIKDGTATIAKLPSDLSGEVSIPPYITYNNTKYIVNNIGSSALLDCSTITEISIPTNITNIGSGAFKNCTSLTNVWYEGSEQEYSRIVIASNNAPLNNAVWHYNSCIQYDKQHEHTYDTCEDASCNRCGYARVVSGHNFNDCLDTTCNSCDFIRSEGHTYQNHADAECDICGNVRVPTEHTYSNSLDLSCNECGEIRVVAGVYAIIYHLDGGTNAVKNPDSYTAEDSITLKDATKEGYTFAGWYLDDAKTQKITNISNRTGNIDIYAKFTSNTYTATFVGNGADKLGKIRVTLLSTETNESKTVYIEGGNSFNPYNYWSPTSSEYIFLGWTYNSSLINSSITINQGAGVEIRAKWKKNTTGDYVTHPGEQYYLSPDYGTETQSFYTTNEACYISWSALSESFYKPTGTTVKSSWSITTSSGTVASSYNNPGSYSGSKYIEPGTLVTVSCSVDKGAANYDVDGWIRITCTSKRANDGKLVASNSNQIMQQEFDSMVSAPAVSRDGYKFLGWYDSQDNIMTDTWQYTEAKTFTAKWELLNYDITYELDGGVNNASNPTVYTTEDTITLKDPTKPGYTFKGWYSDVNFTTQATSISKKTGNITLYAKWAVNSYNLTLNANEGGFAPKVTFISDGVEIKSCYLYGQDTITAYRPDIKEGYIFAGWYTNSACTSLFKFNGTIANDITLYAKWVECNSNIANIESVGKLNTTIQGKTEQLYAFVSLADGKITVTSESNNLDLCGILYDASKTALISADDISSTDLDFTYTYSIKAGQLYYIAVKGNTASTVGQANINIVWTGDCTITGTTHQNRQFTVIYGTNYKLPPKPIREGYVFLGWFDENNTQITDGTWNFVTDKTLTAKWEEATYHTVVFKDLAGNIISSETYYLSEDIIAPELPTKAPDETYIYHAKWDNDYTGFCTGDAVYSPTFDLEYIEYTIVFVDEEGTELSSETYHWGDVVTTPTAPTKAPDANYANFYTFAGWDSNVVRCAGDATYTATYTAVPLKKLVLISQPNQVRYRTGESLDLTGLALQCIYANDASVSLENVDAPFINADLSTSGRKTVTITIAGQSVEFEIYVHDAEETVVTVDSSLYPQSSHDYSNNLDETKTFTYPGAQSLVITFNNQTSVENNYDYIYVYDGAGNQIAKYTGTTAANKTLTITGDTFKVRLTSDYSNVKYGYAFSSIQANMNNAGEIIHRPVIDPATVTCTQNGLTEGSHCDICGDILVEQEEVAALGHDYKTVFTWSEDHTSCTVVITCDRGCGLYEVVECTVTHSESNQAQTLHTAVAEYDGERFTDILTCGNFLITFKDWDGTQISSTYYHAGDTVIVPADPARAADMTYTYTFAGWDKNVVDCAGIATYTATYTSNYIDYTVVFKNWNGDVLATKTYHYGDKVTAPSDPTKAADQTYTYTFAGWDKDVVNCAGDAIYTATYTSTYIDYTVVFKNWDGNILSTKTYHYGDTVAFPTNPTRPYDDDYIYTFASWDKEITVCNGNAVYTATYNKTAIAVTSIAVTTLPLTTTYIESTSLDDNGMILTVYYNNNTSKEVKTGWVSEYDFSNVGTSAVKVTYGGKTCTYDVSVVAKTLTDIAVESEPNKLEYLEGDANLDTDGLVIRAYYNNDTSEIISGNYTVTGYTSTPGEKTITVTYQGKTATFTVNVKAKSVTSISVTKKPNKLTYLEGDSFDKTGMVITAYYNNNTSSAVTDYTISGYTSTVGTKTITVSYGGKTATFTITVKSKIPSSVSSSKYTISGNTIRKITAGTTVSSLLSGLNEGTYCKVYKGSSQVSGTTAVGTGMVVKIMDGSTVKATYTIIVTGDTNGDGDISITDMVAIKAHVLGKTLLTGVYSTAADTSGDNGVSVTDFIQVKAKILGKGTITAR